MSRSDAWKFFKKLDDKKSAECKICIKENNKDDATSKAERRKQLDFSQSKS